MERKNGNWTIKETKKLFENEFFKVFEDQVIQPDGKDGRYATIDFLPGIAVLPIDDDGFIYLTEQFRYAIGRFDIEAVAGGFDVEDPQYAAKRELREELGIEAEEWTRLGLTETLTSIATSTSDLYLARGLAFIEPEREAAEELKPVKMTLADAFEKVMKGEITHGDTCVLILKAAAKVKM